MNKFRFTIHALAFAIFMLAFASAAQAQASRTWVSGVGDDANPCSRTAPCKTFAGAISKTAVNGDCRVQARRMSCQDPVGTNGSSCIREVMRSALMRGTLGSRAAGAESHCLKRSEPKPKGLLGRSQDHLSCSDKNDQRPREMISLFGCHAAR
jgi:hypothetical protein